MTTTRDKLQKKLDNLSDQPGVYLFKDKTDKVIYVGKANILKNRVRSYFQSSRNLDTKTQLLVRKIADLETILLDSEIEALILEANLIKKYKPRYNINLRDDKSYPYIRLTNEPYPRVFVTRKIIQDGSKYLGPYTDVKNLRYIMTIVRKIFPIRSCKHNIDQKSIEQKKVKICLDYHINRCQGPCEGLVSQEEYREMIQQVEKFLKGRTRDLLAELQTRMNKQARELQFEKAAKTRDQVQLIENYYSDKQKVVIPDFEDRDVIAVAAKDDDSCAVIFKLRDGKVVGRQHFYLNGTAQKPENEICEEFVKQYYIKADFIPKQILVPAFPDESKAVYEKWLQQKAGMKVEFSIPQIGEKKKLMSLCQKNAKFLLDELVLQRMKRNEKLSYNVQILQKDLKLKFPPARIEAFDISNLQGKDAVASMVCFIDGYAKKSEYRHFKIQTKDTPDDFAMMREVVFRRYSRVLDENLPRPDLILIDGGKGQLSSAFGVLKQLNLQDIPIIGLAKKLEEVFFPEQSEPLLISRRSSGLKLLQQLRDESHRFAITYHRKLRDKRTLKSPLDDIKGIGPARRNQLLKKFKSIKRLKSVSVAELVKEGKLPENIAILVHEQLNK